MLEKLWTYFSSFGDALAEVYGGKYGELLLYTDGSGGLVTVSKSSEEISILEWSTFEEAIEVFQEVIEYEADTLPKNA